MQMAQIFLKTTKTPSLVGVPLDKAQACNRWVTGQCFNGVMSRDYLTPMSSILYLMSSMTRLDLAASSALSWLAFSSRGSALL